MDDGSSQDAPQTPDQTNRHPPLVIVSEQGRHSQASRRIVRAQAARASAAQSRVTRARNREERGGSAREIVQSPSINSQTPTVATAAKVSDDRLGGPFQQQPLAGWLTKALNITASQLTEGTARFDGSVGATTATATAAFGQANAFGVQATSVMTGKLPTADTTNRQLPMALPRGFAVLQQRLPVSDALLQLLTRTACVDFASPGVEQRLHQLLFDLIVFSGVSSFTSQSSLPVQGHLRIACTCLTIFQGQRANGQLFAHDQKYQVGLEAAWSEVTTLDANALAEPKSAEASLWAVFIISVTTGATASYFRQQLQNLLRDLQLS